VVDVVVGVNRRLRPHDAARKLDRAVRDHFVGVHVRLGTRSGLEHDERELVVERPVDNVLRGPHDEVDLLAWQLAELPIRQGGALFQDAQRADDRSAPPVALHADREVTVGAFRLGAPQVIRRDLDVTESVFFDSEFCVNTTVGWHATLGVWDVHARAIVT